MPERQRFGYARFPRYTGVMEAIADRWARIKDELHKAARQSGRTPDAVRLVAVSKNHPITAIQAAVDLGQCRFGENRVQEALQKIDVLANPRLEWHFLGPLQRNKARFLPGRFQWFHALEDLALADTLSRHAKAAEQSLQVLIEINITGDLRKHGLAPAHLSAFLEAYYQKPRPGLHLRGLMTIGPQGGSDAACTRAFAALRHLAERARHDFDLKDFHELSMGMSDDYALAIAEGATIVRIGSALFGERGAAPTR